MAKVEDCFACGAAVPDDAVTCPACSYPVGAAFESQPDFDRAAEPVGPRSGLRAAAVVLAAAVVVAGVVLVVDRSNGGSIAETAAAPPVVAGTATEGTASPTTSDDPSTNTASTNTASTNTGPTPAPSTAGSAVDGPAALPTDGSSGAGRLGELDTDAAALWANYVVVVEAIGCGSGAITSGVVVGDRLALTSGEIAAHPWVVRVYDAEGTLLAANAGAGDNLVNGRTESGALTLLSLDTTAAVPSIPAEAPLVVAGDDVVIVGWADLNGLDDEPDLIPATVADASALAEQVELIVDQPLARSVVGAPAIGGDGVLVGVVKSLTANGVRLAYPWDAGLEADRSTCASAREWVVADDAARFRNPVQRLALEAQAAVDRAAELDRAPAATLVPLGCDQCLAEAGAAVDSGVAWRFGRHLVDARIAFVTSATGEQLALDDGLFSDALTTVSRLACSTWRLDTVGEFAPVLGLDEPGEIAGAPADERAMWNRADEINPSVPIDTTELIGDLVDLCE